MKRINYFLIVISIVMIGLISGNTLILSHIKALIETGSIIQKWMGITVAVFLLIIVLFHFIELISLVVQFKYFKRDNILSAAAFVTGFFSLFLLTVDVVMLKDIGNEYMFNYNVNGEWTILFTGHVFHGLFGLILLIHCISVNGRVSNNAEMIFAVKDESLFLTVHQIGIISAVLGFVCIFLLNKSGVPREYLSGLLFLSSIVILIPYGLAAVYWIFTKRKEKPSEWYDEKQFMDISRGALITLIISMLTLIVLYFLLTCKIIGFDVIIYFPSFLFLILLVFSASTLYLSKKA